MDILGFLKPFSDLTSREKDVLAIYIRSYLSLRKQKYEKEDVFKLIFQYNHTKYISDELSEIDNEMTMASVRNHTSRLRKKGLLTNKSISEDFIPLFENINDSIHFEFITKD